MKKHITKQNIALYLEHIWYGFLVALFLLYLGHKNWLEPYPTPNFLATITLLWGVIGTMSASEKRDKVDKDI
jgi:hypothetical protein